MQTVTLTPSFVSWREAARDLLAKEIPPAEILFEDGTQSPSLFANEDLKAVILASPKDKALSYYEPRSLPVLSIPKSFLDLGEMVACHREPERWSLLYQAAYRLTLGRERNLLQVPTDPLVRRLSELAKAISRDRHKMKAFVRFRKIGLHEESGREQFVAWFEPEHLIVELTAPFFAKRFASFDWSILTPDCCAHWDGDRLEFTGGVDSSQAPKDDELEDYWRTYYASIFNPARLKLKAMQSEMPKKYWKNLPEAGLIADLTSEASFRVGKMVADGPNTARGHVSAKVPQGAQHPDTDQVGLAPTEALARVAELTLKELDSAATACRYCPLYEAATQTVFGEGPSNARLMIIGEQPGDQEDIAGRPFVGPAGQVLDRALQAAGLRREDIYLTNTVKHFKFRPEGRRRLHERANAEEIHRCKPWVFAEILKVQPEVIVLLGSTAAQALIDPHFQVLRQRGLVEEISPLAATLIATVHPSSLLRLGNRAEQERGFASFVADLKLATAALG